MSEPASVAVSEERSVMKNQVRRTAWWGGGFLLLLFFWDAILGGVLHLLLYLIEYLELGLEDTLELLFHLEVHDAQILTAWIGFAAFATLGGYLYLWASRSLRSRFQTWPAFFAWTKSKMQANWLVLSVLTAGLLAKFLLF